MKLLIIFILGVFCLTIGWRFYYKYKKRLLFFDALIFLCQKFDVEIAFSRQRVQNIIENLDDKIKQNLFGLDKNFLICLSSENLIEKDNLFKNISFLNNEEENTIFLFFKSLGRSDLENQLKEIKNYETKFSSFQSFASQEFKKYGKLSIKLGILSCLIVVVVFL